MFMPYWFDGNNLIGQSATRSKTDPGVRRAFLSQLSDYHKSGGGRFLIYFDGDDPDRSVPPAGIRVRYSAPLSTDEAILRGLKDMQRPGEVIVVSNDRELMMRCRNAGAAALGWQEFALKMRSRRIQRDMQQDARQSVDLDEWINYFGLDKSKI